jgi:hypothetical protein
MSHHPDFQLQRFCNEFGTKKIQIFPAIDYNLYRDITINVYEFVDPNCDLILFDTTLIPNCAEQCFDWVKSLKIDHEFLYVTGNYSYFNTPDPNIVYFPFYYFQSLDNPTREVYDIKQVRPYPMQCFNLNPWLHKTINIVQMSQKFWFNRTLSTFHWLNPPNTNIPPTNIVQQVLEELTNEETSILNSLNLPITIDLPNEPYPAGWVYASNASRAHQLSYIDYVVESGVTEQFISEKIWKPLFSGQLFLCLGPPGVIQHLRDLGFNTFDDVIDHSKYDTILGSSPDDIRSKVSIILDLADNLLSKDLDKIWDQTYEQRLCNFKLITSEEFKYKILDKLVKKIT